MSSKAPTTKTEEGKQATARHSFDLELAVDAWSVFLQVVHDISSELEAFAVAQKIIDGSCTLLKCDRTSLFYVDDDALVLLVAKGAKNIYLPKDKGIAGHCASTGEAVRIKDAWEDDRFDSSFDKASGYRTKSVLAVPIYDTNNNMIAVLQAINKKDDQEFSEHDLVLFQNLGKHASVALNNSEMYERTKVAERKATSLLDVVTILHSQPNSNSLIFALSNNSPQVVNADRSTLYLVDRSRNQLVVMQGDLDIRFGLDQGIAGHVATTGEIVNIPDCYDDDRFNPEFDKKSGYVTKSMLCMPIPGKEGIVGVLQVINRLDDSCFTSSDENTLSILLKIAGPILENSHMFKRTEKKAYGVGEAMISSPSPRGERKKFSYKTDMGVIKEDSIPEILEEEEEDEDTFM